MKIAIMQPYLFPYIGYFSLIRNTDYFVFFDVTVLPRLKHQKIEILYLDIIISII